MRIILHLRAARALRVATTKPLTSPSFPLSSVTQHHNRPLHRQPQHKTYALRSIAYTTATQSAATATTMASSNATMRAVMFDKTGDSSVLHVRETAKPEPGPDQVLIKLEWAGINFIDTYRRTGLYPVPLPAIAGAEGAGVIESVGSAVPSDYGLAVGDRVAVYGGACAEYFAAKPSRVMKLPDGISTRDGAAVLIQGLTALTLLRDAHEVKPGEVVLVQAAAGGTGGQIVQMAKHLGATVIGTVSTHAKAEVARRHGCDHVIVYTEKDVLTEVMALTDGLGCHAVFSGVGQATFEADLEATRRRGTFATFGNASGAVKPFSVLALGKKNVRLLRPRLDAYVETKEEWDARCKELAELVEKGVVKVEIGGEYTLETVAKAHDDLAGKKTTGKLVVKIA